MKKILLIDDNAENLFVLEELLSSVMPDTQVIAAQSGVQGIKKCLQEKPDVVLLDIVMPEMSGFEVCKRIKSNKNIHHLPVAFITAMEMAQKDMVSAIQAGADGFISKPVNKNELVSLLEKLFALKDLEDEKIKEKRQLQRELTKSQTLSQNKESRLRETESRMLLLANAIQSISECVCITDLSKKILFVNEAFIKTYGYQHEELLGASLQSFISEVHYEEEIGSWEETTLKGGWSGEQLHKRKNGEEFPVHVSTSLVYDEEQQVVAAIGIISDITSQKYKEWLLKKQIVTISGKVERLEEIAFDELFNIEDIQKIQDAFSKATGVSSVIVDSQGVAITKQSNPSHLCEHIIKKTEKGRINCHLSDIALCQINHKGPNMLQCLSGSLLDGGASITIANKHIASWLVGQVIDEKADEQQMIQYATEIGADKHQYARSLKLVPKMSVSQFKSICDALFHLTEYLSALALQNIQQAKLIATSKRDELVLSVLFNISNAAIVSQDEHELIQSVQLELSRLLDTSNFFVALLNKEKNELYSPYFKDEKETFQNWGVENSVTGLVIKEKRQLLFKKKELETLEAENKLTNVGTIPEVWLGTPLVQGKEVVGAFVVQHYTNADAFNEESGKLLSFVSDHISLALRRKKSEMQTREALTQAQESDRLKSVFLASMSHELRTPLNAIIGFASLQKQDADHGTIIQYADIIQNSGEHLLSIVEDIFNIVMIESGKFKAQYEVFNLGNLIEEVYSDVLEERMKLNKGYIHVKFSNFDKAYHRQIVTDRNGLHRILSKILHNALVFTLSGEVEFGYRFINHDQPANIEFYVKDTGIGIDPSKQDYIFKAFTQADEALSRRFDGLGLGLFIAKKYTEKFGGKIWFEPNLGGGTIFYFTIPLLDAESFSDNTIQKKKDDLSDSLAKTVLIAAHNSDEFNLLKTLLNLKGIETMQATNGVEAIRLCMQHERIGLSMIDASLVSPSEYVIEALKKARKNMPLILLTSSRDNGSVEVLKDRCDDMLNLPVDPKKFNSILNHWLK